MQVGRQVGYWRAGPAHGGVGVIPVLKITFYTPFPIDVLAAHCNGKFVKNLENAFINPSLSTQFHCLKIQCIFSHVRSSMNYIFVVNH